MLLHRQRLSLNVNIDYKPCLIMDGHNVAPDVALVGGGVGAVHAHVGPGLPLHHRDAGVIGLHQIFRTEKICNYNFLYFIAYT